MLSSQTTELVIDGNTFTDVDNVFYIDDFAGGTEAGDRFTFTNNVLTRVGGADGIFLRNVSDGRRYTSALTGTSTTPSTATPAPAG